MNKAERAYELQQYINLYTFTKADVSKQAEELDQLCDSMTAEEADRFLDLCEGKVEY